jgi:hypothetical protein
MMRHCAQAMVANNVATRIAHMLHTTLKHLLYGVAYSTTVMLQLQSIDCVNVLVALLMIAVQTHTGSVVAAVTPALMSSSGCSFIAATSALRSDATSTLLSTTVAAAAALAAVLLSPLLLLLTAAGDESSDLVEVGSNGELPLLAVVCLDVSTLSLASRSAASCCDSARTASGLLSNNSDTASGKGLHLNCTAHSPLAVTTRTLPVL